MPNIASKKKNVRKIAKANTVNRGAKARILTAGRKIEEALSDAEKKADTKSLQELLSMYFKFVDKAACRNIIKKNTAARRKSYYSKKAFPPPSSTSSPKAN